MLTPDFYSTQFNNKLHKHFATKMTELTDNWLQIAYSFVKTTFITYKYDCKKENKITYQPATHYVCCVGALQ